MPHDHLRTLRAGALAASFALGMGLTPSHAASLNVLHSFCEDDCQDGVRPLGRLVTDPSGAFYGVALLGGTRDAGSVYMLKPSRRTGELKFQQIYEFCPIGDCSTGMWPRNGLVIDTAGNLYGTASIGSPSEAGTVFELVPNSKKTQWTLNVLFQFCPGGGPSCPDGKQPVAGLTYAGQASGAPYDGTSPLYGTTTAGGAADSGTIFKLSPRPNGHWRESVIYDFCSARNCKDGTAPIADMAMDGAGNLFGTAAGGGAQSLGTVFELAAHPPGRGRPYRVLHDFCVEPDCADGSAPRGGVTLDASGNLFGTAAAGGANNNNGVVYKIASAAGTPQYQVLYSFCSQPRCTDGSEPENSLTLDDAGNLFGVTDMGGGLHQAGTIFKLGTDNALTTLHTFCIKKNKCPDGAVPGGTLLIDGSGNLFGTGEAGGKTNGGVVFELTP